MSRSPQQSPVSPTRARHVGIGFAMGLAAITYIDRVAIAVAAPFIREDLNLTPVQMEWAHAALGRSYALLEIPGGWLGDRIGPRRVLHAYRHLVVRVHRGDGMGVECGGAGRDSGAVRRGRGDSHTPLEAPEPAVPVVKVAS